MILIIFAALIGGIVWVGLKFPAKVFDPPQGWYEVNGDWIYSYGKDHCACRMSRTYSFTVLGDGNYLWLLKCKDANPRVFESLTEAKEFGETMIEGETR